jgi:replicative DNA helicase
MDRILRSVLQVGNQPDAEDAQNNWIKLQEHALEFPNEEDNKIHKYLVKFYEQMSSPPDYSLVKEYFESLDDIESITRLEEIKNAQFYIRTNYLAILRAELDRQHVKGVILLCRDATAIAEHGRNLDKPVDGKKTLRGVNDAVNYLYTKLSDFTKIEGGERLEGVISDDADEVLNEYEVISKTNKYANRNLFGLEPVDVACRGHRIGEYWIHAGFAGELKCLTGDNTIYDHKSQRRRSIKEMYDTQKLPVITALYKEGVNLKLVNSSVSHIVENGVRLVSELRLKSGKRVTATDNHKFFTIDGWKELSNITKDDWVAVPKQMTVDSPNVDYFDEEIKIIGYLIGDGTITNDILLTASFNEIREDFKNSLEAIGFSQNTLCHARCHDPGHYHFREDLSGVPYISISRKPNSPVKMLLKKLRLHGKTAYYKNIPDEFFGLSEHQTALLLGALWSTDGSIHVGDHHRKDRKCMDHRNDLKYYSMSERLCLDVQSLLLKLGIQSTVTKGNVVWNGTKRLVYVTRIIGSHSKRIFCDRVRVIGKEYRLDHANNRLLLDDDTVYPSKLIPDNSFGVMPNGKRRYASQVKHRVSTVGKTLRYFANTNPYIEKILNSDIIWEKVVSIKQVGERMTYDLSVPKHHSFVVNDIISHNSSVAINYAYNNVAVYGKNIFYAILEMPYSQLRKQIYALHSSHGKFVTQWNGEDGYIGLDYRQIRDGELSPRDKERFITVARDFQSNTKGKLYIWRPDKEVTIDDIKRKAEMFHNKYGCDGIVIDHLGLVKSTGSVRDYVVSLNSIVREARMLALNFARGRAVPVLALFQMNRQGKMRADKNDGRYDFASLSYANECEKSADVITYTYLNDDLRRDGKFYLGNLKNRDNPVFERMVGKIIWQTKRMRAVESGMLDMNNDQILTACNQISLNIEDLYAA